MPPCATKAIAPGFRRSLGRSAGTPLQRGVRSCLGPHRNGGRLAGGRAPCGISAGPYANVTRCPAAVNAWPKSSERAPTLSERPGRLRRRHSQASRRHRIERLRFPRRRGPRLARNRRSVRRTSVGNSIRGEELTWPAPISGAAVRGCRALAAAVELDERAVRRSRSGRALARRARLSAARIRASNGSNPRNFGAGVRFPDIGNRGPAFPRDGRTLPGPQWLDLVRRSQGNPGWTRRREKTAGCLSEGIPPPEPNRLGASSHIRAPRTHPAGRAVTWSHRHRKGEVGRSAPASAIRSASYAGEDAATLAPRAGCAFDPSAASAARNAVSWPG